LFAATVDGAHRKAGDLRDLVVGELLYVTEDDHLPERGRDLVQRLLDVLVLDRALRMSIGREGLIRQLHLVLLVISIHALDRVQATSLALAVLRAREVTGDGIQPRRKLRDAAIRMSVAIDPKERLLKKVFAAPHISEKTVQIVHQSLRIALYEDIERLDRARLELRHQILIRHLLES